MKFLFAPVGIVTGLLAGMLAKKGFERLWAVIDDEEPPEPDNARRRGPETGRSRWLSRGRSSASPKAIVDHGARRGFAALTGALARRGRAARRRPERACFAQRRGQLLPRLELPEAAGGARGRGQDPDGGAAELLSWSP